RGVIRPRMGGCPIPGLLPCERRRSGAQPSAGKVAVRRLGRLRGAAVLGGDRRRGGAGGAEVGAAAEGAVEGGPDGAGGELLLEAVEGAEAAAEVVHHVDGGGLAGGGQDGRAVLQLAVVAEDDVQDRLGEGGREAVEVLDDAADAVVAERDLALQAAE